MLNIIQNTIGSLARAGFSVIRDGLKMWLPFTKADVGATTQTTPDKSGNDNNAILKTGKTLVFNNNDSVETSFPSSKTIKTIAFWIYPTHSAQFETLFNLGITNIPVSPLGDRVIQLNHLTISNKSNYPLNFDVYIDGVYRGETTYNGDNPTLSLNQWQRVVFVNSNGTSTVNDTFDIAYTGSGSHGRFKMSDLQIYGAEFTTDDIAYDYANPQKLVTDNASSNVTLSSLYLYLAMTEGAGSIAYDSSSGTRYDGVIIGATYESGQQRILQTGMISWAKSTPVSDEILLPYNPNNVTEDILGNAVRVKGSGFNLDGTGYAEVLNDNDFDIPQDGAFTFMGWLKFKFVSTGSGLNVVYANGGLSTDTNTFSISTNSSNKVIAYVSGTFTEALDSSFDKTDGDWVFFAITRNAGSDIKFYLNKVDTDGVEKPMLARTRSNNNSLTNVNVKYIGRDSGSTRFYKERIDDLILYNTELSLDDITQNFNATKSGHNN